ncbi:PREDICTED: tumor necrosis factor receptor superfamily member 5-like isoform X2 [Cyprinodon variegatus]|uniref:tumor necrosis factor receptor superfamily member 5-like isoform X2 n=1 Tax=Cyprinodon variegatus TaxID=28743 RepID=UPI000742CA7D|nr:PREDICTED: tumor necrosis factor receptor superfamily member 5-like isoform X2 [Cyprinodon variegatus]
MFRPLLLLLSALMVVRAAEHLCDTLTQYEKGAQCCQMCEPGKKMIDNNCHAPKCEPCGKDEYLDTYSTEAKCERQPYCDPNKNFVVPVHQIDKKTDCTCKPGFHCSGKACLSCLPHKTCGPGEGVLHKGSPTHDTECQSCPEGTFSNETSMNDGCVKHTECPLGYIATVPGTAQTDTVCEIQRSHVILPIVLTVVIIALILAGVLFYLKSRKCLKNRKKMVCVECIGPKVEPKEDPTKLMLEKTPVETEDASIPSGISEEHGRSENGKIVCPVVEEGKAECLSRQESQLSASSTVSYN